MRWKLAVALLFSSYLGAQTRASAPADPLQGLQFLQGTWQAQTQGNGSGPAVSGTYVFRRELGGHVLARHSSSDACKGPADFDCDHHDLLYVYQDSPGQPLKAIYFDNEGHVIHYDVLTPTPAQVMFLSDSSQPGPRFRLTYQLSNAVMSGKFQMQMPGQSEWKSYLEWSGGRK